jgi:hypothetical protein
MKRMIATSVMGLVLASSAFAAEQGTEVKNDANTVSAPAAATSAPVAGKKVAKAKRHHRKHKDSSAK